MKNIAVFCGSSSGFDERYEAHAYLTGKVLAQKGIRVIYGGACVGLMGAVANGALEAGGEVVGVLPFFLQTKEITHTGLTALHLVETMHERKLKMHELSDGIIALPGGFGTMEELFEMLTWAQLGLHGKPMGLLNTAGYYDHLIAFISTMTQGGLLKETDADRLLVDESVEKLLIQMGNYKAPAAPKWITEDRT